MMYYVNCHSCTLFTNMPTNSECIDFWLGMSKPNMRREPPHFAKNVVINCTTTQWSQHPIFQPNLLSFNKVCTFLWEGLNAGPILLKLMMFHYFVYLPILREKMSDLKKTCIICERNNKDDNWLNFHNETTHKKLLNFLIS